MLFACLVTCAQRSPGCKHCRSADRDRSNSGASASTTFGTLDADVLQEIAVMKQLDHPNIVRLVEVIGAAPKQHSLLLLRLNTCLWQAGSKRETAVLLSGLLDRG